MSENEEDEEVKNNYQGLFVTETVFGNPNGSFINNEPRNVDGQVFTTDKCIKYNVRNYIHQTYEKEDPMENFVFFYPRKTEDAEEQDASYEKKTTVFEKYFDKEFKKLKKKCPDIRMFGGTFSFKGSDEGSLHGPIQVSYGLDLMGADILTVKLGTPFSTKTGSQTTTGENKVVDHAVIGYDLVVNPNVQPGLLKKDDFEMFKEGIVEGTNLRKSTSKKTDAKLLMLVKYEEGKNKNVGEMKHLLDVESEKITDPNEHVKELVLDFGNVKDKLENVKKDIEKIQVYKAPSVVVENFFDGNEDVTVKMKSFKDM